MRTVTLTLACALIALTGCNRQDAARTREQTDSAARKAGRDAYQASHELKKEAKEAAQDLRDAGKEFRQGWQEQKHATPPPAADHTRTNQPRR